MKQRLFYLLLIASLLLAGCARQKTQPPVYPGVEWTQVDKPEKIGWSSAKLAQAQAYAKQIGSDAVMVIDNGIVVAAWGDMTHKYFCHSMRKSLMSALYGIYMAAGKIDLSATLKDLGVDDLTPLTDVEKTATVKDLLSARSGVYIEAAGEAASMKDMRPTRGSHDPGTFWYYNNWDFNALGTIFDQLSGERNIYTAFDKRIADPIGMQDYDPEELNYNYEPYSRHPYYGFRLSARDAARFGLLFLRNGRWSNKQVVPADWVRESTAAHSNIGFQSGYGYMWWLGEGEGGFANVNEGPGSYYAAGAGGQTILVMPARDLVVVHLVDTDSGGMVMEQNIGTLLWMILDAAGETDIGDAPLLERATGKRLTAKSLPGAFAGKTISTQQNGIEATATFHEDGSISASVEGMGIVNGRWWISGDNFCHDLGADFGGPRCFQVLLDGTKLRLFDLGGYGAQTLEYVLPRK